jgi:hypothetical protein
MSLGRIRSMVQLPLPYQGEVMKDRPEIYWRLGDTGGSPAYDLSGHNRHGGYAGGTQGVPGLVPGDLAWRGARGNTTTQMPFEIATISNDHYTWEFWIIIYSFGSDYNPAAFVAVENGHFSGVGCTIFISDTGDIRFNQFESGAGQWRSTVATAALKLNTVSHVCVVKDGTVVTIYVNGVDVTTSHASHGPTVPNGQWLEVNNSHNYGPYSGDATYDEFAVYSYALSPARILAHHNARMRSFDPLTLAPVVWMDAADSKTTRDGSTNAPANPSGLISQWRNKGSSGVHFDATGGLPTAPQMHPSFQNGKNAIWFQNYAYSMTSAVQTTATQYTLFCVCNITAFSLPTGNVVSVVNFGQDDANGYGLTMRNDSGTRYWAILHGGRTWLASSNTVSGTNLLSMRADATTGKFRVNRADKTLSTYASPNPPTLTCQINGINGNTFRLMEVLLFPVALSDFDIRMVEDYLANKWGLPAAVVVTSPDPDPPVIMPEVLAALTPSLWLDAMDAGTLFLNDGETTWAGENDPVGRWSDKSGNRRHGTQAVVGSRPLHKVTNGLPGLLFENKFLQHQLSQPVGNTVFVVASRTGPFFDLQGLFSATAPGQPMACHLMGKSAGVDAWGGYRADTGHFNSGYPVASSSAVLTMTSSATGGVMRHNKKSETSYTGSVFHQDSEERRVIGAARTTQDFWQGYIHEIVVLPFAATTAQREQVQDYLMTKWRIDQDANDYLDAVTAAGVVPTQVQANALTTFIMAEKAAGRWAKHKRLYLPIWGNAAANAIDLVTRTSGTWAGPITHAPGYAEAGDGGSFLATASIIALGLTRTDHCLSVLVYRGHQAQRSTVVLAGLVIANGIQLIETMNHEMRWYSGNTNFVELGGNTGIFVGSRTTLREINLFRRTAAGTSSASELRNVRGFSDQGISGFRRLSAGNPMQGNQRIGVFHIGLGLDVAQAEAFSANLKTLWESCSGLAIP